MVYILITSEWWNSEISVKWKVNCNVKLMKRIIKDSNNDNDNSDNNNNDNNNDN